MTDYKQLAEIYQYESEVFEIFYKDRINVSKAFIVFGGIITQLRSDIVLYESKHGKSDKLDKQKERTKILTDLFCDFQGLDEDIVRMKELFRKCNSEKLRLTEENEKLTKELEGVKKAWEKL